MKHLKETLKNLSCLKQISLELELWVILAIVLDN